MAFKKKKPASKKEAAPAAKPKGFDGHITARLAKMDRQDAVRVEGVLCSQEFLEGFQAETGRDAYSMPTFGKNSRQLPIEARHWAAPGIPVEEQFLLRSGAPRPEFGDVDEE